MFVKEFDWIPGKVHFISLRTQWRNAGIMSALILQDMTCIVPANDCKTESLKKTMELIGVGESSIAIFVVEEVNKCPKAMAPKGMIIKIFHLIVAQLFPCPIGLLFCYFNQLGLYVSKECSGDVFIMHHIDSFSCSMNH